MLEQLIQLLRSLYRRWRNQSQFDIPQGAIVLAQKTANFEPNTLPIILWQYGFFDLRELDLIFDLLEVS